LEAGTDNHSPLWGRLFAGSSPVVDTNDRCSGQDKCVVGRGVGTLNPGGRCEPKRLHTTFRTRQKLEITD
jgi:hypothetical protein